MRKGRNIIYLLLFFIITSFNGAFIILKHDKKKSEYENRELTLRPKLTIDSIKKGEFPQIFDKYISDQVYKKDVWQKEYVEFNFNILNKNKVNNFVKTDDNYIFYYNSYTKEDISKLKTSIEKSIGYIKNAEKIVNKNGGKLYFVTVPAQSDMFQQYYPQYFNNGQGHYVFQRNTILKAANKNRINYINMFDILSKYKPYDVYYKTEHHYNFLGAYHTYSEIIKTLEKDQNLKFDRNIVNYDDLNVETKEFKGSFNRQLMYTVNSNDKLLLPHINTSQWEILNNKEKVSDVINYESPFYDEAFMNGNNSETIIKTNKPEFDNALIIGDSFTNPLEPLIAMNFNETRSLDFRSNDVKVDFKKYIENYKPKVVLVIVYEQSVRQTDKNIIMKQ